jgi:hypothetical protein
MSEIEKMYKNAGITLIEENEYGACCLNPFTPEKQLKILEFIFKKYKNYLMLILSNGEDIKIEYLAKIINTIWQDLTEEEKQQVKGILK